MANQTPGTGDPQKPANGNGNGQDKPPSRSMVLSKEFKSWEGVIKAVLPKHVPFDRFVKIASRAYLENQQLIECHPRSMVKAAVQCAELGLDPSPLLGECAFVPYNNTVKVRDGNQWVERKQLEVQLQPMYPGLIKLAKQTGDISDVYAVVVDESEKDPVFDPNTGKLISGFYEEQGTVRRLHHNPKRNIGKDRKLWAVYAVVKLKDGTDHFEVLDRDDIEHHRSFSKAKDAPAWRDHYNEMAKKTAIRAALKTIPKSAEKPMLATALGADNAVDMGTAFNTEGSEVIDTTGEVVSEGPVDPNDPPFGKEPAQAQKSRTDDLGEKLGRTATGATYNPGTGEVRS